MLKFFVIVKCNISTEYTKKWKSHKIFVIPKKNCKREVRTYILQLHGRVIESRPVVWQVVGGNPKLSSRSLACDIKPESTVYPLVTATPSNSRPVKWGPLHGIIHILAAIKFDSFIPTKNWQKFTVNTPRDAILDQKSKRRSTFRPPHHVLDDFSLRRVGINFRFETGVVDFARFRVKYFK